VYQFENWSALLSAVGGLEKRRGLKHACLATLYDLCGREKMRGVKRDCV
jgi:hypothetical protein